MVMPDDNLSEEEVQFDKGLMTALFQRAYVMYALRYNIILQRNMSFPSSMVFLVGQQHLVNVVNVWQLAIQGICSI